MATWSHEELRRVNTKRGWKVTVLFTRDGSGEKYVCRFGFDSEQQIDDEGPTRINLKKTKLELKWSSLNYFDLGDESINILQKLIIAIRNNPDLEVSQVVNWYNSNYPDSIWNGEKLLLKIRQHLKYELGFEPTWIEFKTYIIDNVFVGVDG